MMPRRSKQLKMFVSLVLVVVFTTISFAASKPKVTKEELKSLLDQGNVVVVDVRTSRDWGESDYKIKGAVRVTFRDVESWASNYSKDTTIIFY